MNKYIVLISDSSQLQSFELKISSFCIVEFSLRLFKELAPLYGDLIFADYSPSCVNLHLLKTLVQVVNIPNHIKFPF